MIINHEEVKFTESQIVAAITKQESGIPAKEVSRELGISESNIGQPIFQVVGII